VATVPLQLIVIECLGHEQPLQMPICDERAACAATFMYLVLRLPASDRIGSCKVTCGKSVYTACEVDDVFAVPYAAIMADCQSHIVCDAKGVAAFVIYALRAEEVKQHG
jgi:hypothetical protein